MSNVELYGRITSSNVQVVRWCMAELGLDYTRHDVGGRFGGLDTPDYRDMNPSGRIPVLKIGDAALFESCAILRYLATAHGSDPFWPRDPLARAQVDKWAEWAKLEISNTFTGPIFWRVVRTPKARHDRPAIAQAVAEFEVNLHVAEGQLSRNTYLAGDAFTLADIVLGHVLYRYFDIEIIRSPFPNVIRYFERLKERPAYQETVMISYDELRDTI